MVSYAVDRVLKFRFSAERTGKDRTQAHAMEDAVASALARIETASEKVSAELSAAASTLKHVTSLAAGLERAESPRARSQLDTLGGAMGDLAEQAEATSSVHILHHHLAALDAAASAFVWLADEDPPGAVQRAISTSEEELGALRAKNEPHSEFADAIEQFLSSLATYVGAEHKTPLSWEDEHDE